MRKNWIVCKIVTGSVWFEATYYRRTNQICGCAVVIRNKPTPGLKVLHIYARGGIPAISDL